MQWYYAKDGGQRGPVSEGEMRDLIAQGVVKPADLVWKEGMGDWLPVTKVAELSTALAAPASAPTASGVPPMQAPSPYQSPVTHQPGFLSGAGADIPTYLWQAIVVTLLCCMPFGIAAIVYAAKVEGLKGAGNWQAAKEASDTAKKWCWVSFGIGLAFWLVYFGLIFAGMISGQA
ncbi:MAG: CD225/dispanin family protein [Akkermansiaceae bacterium]|jgi:hypothetical protein|nr:CD225/dispanin family protein [Akkermansiaceae bacterium]